MENVSVKFFEGFTIYEKGEGPVFMCLHTGPAMETPTNRDDASDTVASLCWINLGGSLIFSNITRKRFFGIDMNREAPTASNAIRMYKKFIEDVDYDALLDYRNRFAWTARDKIDHYTRLKIYDNFWFHAKNLGNFFVSLHRKFTRLKNYPSIMDVVSFRGKGINPKIIGDIITEINAEYSQIFKEIEKDYKNAIILEERRAFSKLGNPSLKELKTPKSDKHKVLADDLKFIKKYAKPSFYKRLENNFNIKNFIMAARNALNNAGSMRVTLDLIFNSGLSHGPIKKLYLNEISNDKIVLEIESNKFLNYWYPEIAAEIICKIIKKIKNVDIYKRYGHKQMRLGQTTSNSK